MGLSLSMGAPRVETEGRASLLGTLKDMQRRLWKRASLSIGTPLGNLKEELFYR